MLSTNDPEASEAILGKDDLMPGQLQDEPQEMPHRFFIVDHQDACQMVSPCGCGFRRGRDSARRVYRTDRIRRILMNRHLASDAEEDN